MRIKKSTNRLTLGVLGKIKTGDKKSNGNKEYPISLDHFRFTSNEQYRVDRMKNLLGEKPTSIRVTFHSNDINEVCSQFFELRNDKGQLVATGDGQDFKKSTQKGWVDIEKDDAYKLPNQLSTQKFKAKWVETLILKVVVLGYPEYGCWEYRTKAKETTIPQIISSFDSVLENAGRCAMMPFVLTVKKHKSNRAEANRAYPVVSLICDMSTEMIEAVQTLSAGVTGLITPQKITEVKQIEAAPKEQIEEAEIID